jgi:hypothetical protein
MSRRSRSIAIFLCLAALSTQTWAAPQFFTNQSSFGATISGGMSFTTNLNFPAGQAINSPAVFAGNGLSVQAVSTNAGAYSLYSFGNSLTVTEEGFGLLFTNFSANAFAFGGLFFNLDTEGNFASGNMVFEALFADLSSLTTNVPSGSEESFFGFIGPTNLLSLSVSGQGGLPAASQLTIGSPVPEPSAIALLLLSSATLVGYAASRRWAR